MIKPLYQELTYLTEKLWIHSFECWEEDKDDHFDCYCQHSTTQVLDIVISKEEVRNTFIGIGRKNNYFIYNPRGSSKFAGYKIYKCVPIPVKTNEKCNTVFNRTKTIKYLADHLIKCAQKPRRKMRK